jgi:Tfp pilus assembly protein PilN
MTRFFPLIRGEESPLQSEEKYMTFLSEVKILTSNQRRRTYMALLSKKKNLLSNQRTSILLSNQRRSK